MSASEPKTPEIQSFDVKDFTFVDGSKLPSLRVAYADINPTASKVALVISCFQGRISTTLNFSSGALRSHRIIVVALLGNGESSSPSNTPNFPKSLDYRDCVNAQHALLTQHLGIEELDAVVGFSMGGQCTYYWSSMYLDFMKHAVVICSSARTSRHNYQFLEGPKSALENSIDYGAGVKATDDASILRGLQAFGKGYSAWLTSAEWFDEGLWTEMGYSSQEEWDRKEAIDDFEGWNPDDLMAKLKMWQNGDVATGGSLEDALGKIKAKVLLMPCRSDQYFRPGANEKELKSLKHGELAVIESVWGHIAGGGACAKDAKFMDETMSKFLGTT